MKHKELPREIHKALHRGVVIPAMPLALDKDRKLDTRRQRVLLRYYLDAGAGGIAAAVHTTQFEIRLPEINLFEPVLRIASDEIDQFVDRTHKSIIKIAGIIGQTEQAAKESRLAVSLGYHAGLLSLAAFPEAPNQILLEHCRAVADIIPVVGFYLQPAVGGRVLNVDFWREFAQIKNVIAIKIAPFNRYQTMDVVRGVIESGRADEIALYTGNDDNILVDLLTEFKFDLGSKVVTKRIVGGLLGHWAVWTRSAVRLLEQIQQGTLAGDIHTQLNLSMQISDSNAAFFDAANNFKGCIVGIHEVLRRQGLMDGLWTLNESEVLSPGQKEEIDRIYKAYPDLNDDDFVAKNLERWLVPGRPEVPPKLN